MSQLTIDLPLKCHNVLSQRKRYKILYGGRGSAKSWSVARYLAVKGAFSPVRVLATREIQNSIKDSVYRLLVDQIYSLNLVPYYHITGDAIRGKFHLTEFIFKGLRHNISEIKSTEGIDVCWVEEGEKVSQDSLDTLIPTIRKEGSELIFTFNPEDEKAPVFSTFVEMDGKPIERNDVAKAHVNWYDNPWFPVTLKREMEWCKQNDVEKYQHVWEGFPKKYGQAVIFKNKIRVESFETPEGVQFYFGADWGFGVDPTCLVRMFIKDRKLFVDQEFYGYGIEIDDLPACWDKVEHVRKWTIRADSARPDTISFMANKGFNCIGAEKGKGSVEDGIEFLKNFEAIVIHPRCVGTKGDFENYRWKVDRITQEVLPIPVDKSNHAPDACRYALEPYMKGNVSIFDVL